MDEAEVAGYRFQIGHQRAHESDAEPKGYDIIIRPVSYPGVILNFDVHREFDYEIAQVLLTLRLFPDEREALRQASNFTIVAIIHGKYHDCRLDSSLLKLGLGNFQLCDFRLHEYSKQQKQFVERVLTEYAQQYFEQVNAEDDHDRETKVQSEEVDQSMSSQIEE
jgi:hypothetical protein